MNRTHDLEKLGSLSALIRHWILTSTNEAGSGHPTSSLSAVELMTDLFFGGHYRFDVDRPDHPNNDRLIFSKGHASPLLYALWAAAGQIEEDTLLTYRQFGSPLEGHPTSRFAFTEAATGSLGQGLSIGLGLALNARHLDGLPYRTYVLLGDSEMAEGSQWEAIQLAAHYKLGNLIGIIDVNRLGQRGETMYGHDLQAYQRRIDAFGWRTILVEDGHDHSQILDAYESLEATEIDAPTMIIARTIKGNGASLLSDEKGWHGKALDDKQLREAFEELGPVDHLLRGSLEKPRVVIPRVPRPQQPAATRYENDNEVPTRDAYGTALCRLASRYPHLVALDGEVCNSTRSQYFRDKHPERFFEMYIAEQNMVGTAVGLSLCGKLPFVSTFAAFLTRAFDQIRMSRHSDANIKLVGSHAGVSIGEDGPSQMGLEDIAMFRTVLDCVVLCPCDAISTEWLVEEMAEHSGICYLRTTRGPTPVIYRQDERFPVGGCKVLRQSDEDQVTVVGTGITVHEALQAYEQLQHDGVFIRVIDLYSIKPIDCDSLRAAAAETGLIITVEDHYSEGGVGEAVRTALAECDVSIRCLAVSKRTRSGTTDQLLDNQGISAASIVQAVSDHRVPGAAAASAAGS